MEVRDLPRYVGAGGPRHAGSWDGRLSGDEAWETKLAALRSYHRAHNHLAPPQDTVWGESDTELVPVGQHMANLRRKGGLGKDPERAEDRAKQLTAIDPDWNCPWPLD